MKRSVGILLGIGILLFPVIFAWFTLRKGHSVLSRVVSFGWLVFCIVAIAAQNPQPAGVASQGNSARPAAQQAAEPEESVIAVDIRKLLGDYKANEVGADNQYNDRLVKTTGIISAVKKDIMGELYVSLGTGAQFEIPELQAFFDESMSDQLGRLQIGTRLTVVCRVNGLMMNVLGKDCVIQ